MKLGVTRGEGVEAGPEGVAGAVAWPQRWSVIAREPKPASRMNLRRFILSPLALPPPLHPAPAAVLVARHDEQQVREAVQVGEHVVRHALPAGQPDHRPLRATADGPREVELRGAGRAAGEDEGPQPRQ